MTQESYAVPLKAPGLVSVNGNSGALNFPPKEMVILLNITAVAGTLPTLNILIEEYDPVSNTYFTIDTIPEQTGAGKVRRTIVTPAIFSGNIRASWTIGGSAGPSFTFSLSALGKPN